MSAPSGAVNKAAEEGELPAVEHDKSHDRYFIPLPGGWEVQTKGKGSTFRIAHDSGRRWMVLDEQLHEPLTAMAYVVRQAISADRASRQVANKAGVEENPLVTVSRDVDGSLKFTPLRDFHVTDGMGLYAAPPATTGASKESPLSALTDERIGELYREAQDQAENGAQASILTTVPCPCVAANRTPVCDDCDGQGRLIVDKHDLADHLAAQSQGAQLDGGQGAGA